MKKIRINISLFLYFLMIGLGTIAQNFQPINVNTTELSSSCTIDGETFIIKAPTEVLTGDGIPLNITLPGTLDPSCNVNISINFSSPNNDIQFVASSNVSFTQTGNTLNTTNPLMGNDGQNFNVFFRFPNNTTCNGEVGSFDVTFEACGQTCTTRVYVIARAANYWTIEKEFVIGDLACATSKWRIKILDNNPNPSGYGNYKISGTVTETTSLPIISGGIISVNANDWFPFKYVTLQNCQNSGTQITNTADYYFTLGDGCEIMQGTVSATSPPLQSPNASLDFDKTIYSLSGIPANISNSGYFEMSAGCSAVYSIGIYNDGNVPWQINSITDLIPTNITITGISDIYWGMGYTGIDPNMWVSAPTISGQTYTFTPATTPYLLNPGDWKKIYLYFDINSSVSAGSIITNNAHINYNAGNSGNNGGGNGNQCAGVDCPSIDQSIHNDSASIDFLVTAAFPVEKFKKCVTNQPAGNIYNIGDTVHFKYIIGNQGSGDLSTTVTDYLGLPNQNLQIVPSSISYSYYEDNMASSNGWPCGNNLTNQQNLTFPVSSNTTDLQNPTFSITNLPGTCEYHRANYLVIEFDAVVLSQIYGSKVNTAYTDDQQGSASYLIDQLGILEVNKYADKEFVENGDTFNYIIEVKNSGTVPLDHISINDQIPSCVNLTGNITATDISGNSINFTQTGNLTLDLNATWQLMPAETLTITIEAQKQGGGNCCNETVTAQGTMITSGVTLEANDGTVDEPAACVKSTECCEIQDFEAHLYENADGSYSVGIAGGSVPIQEVSISVIDYHVEYNQRDCQPQDMGVFGTLATQAQVLNGLLLDNSSNNTSSLTWLPGNPSLLNTAVDFTISKPNVLNLDCCDVDFYFCIKVSIKDVNCNVCEKVICIEKEKPDCDLNIENVRDEYCAGDTIDINWSGSATSGSVDLFLISQTGGQSYPIAVNQSETGSLTWTIPSSFTPCDDKWKIMVRDSENQEECHSLSNIFVIKCCETACECKNWESNVITYAKKIITIPNTVGVSSSIKKEMTKGKTKETECGGIISLQTGVAYVFTAPQFNCNPQDTDTDCLPEYSWEITNVATGLNGVTPGESINLQFNNPETYTVDIIPKCGDNECDKCTITIHVEGKPYSNGIPIHERIGNPNSGNGQNPTNAQDWNSSRSNKTSKTS